MRDLVEIKKLVSAALLKKVPSVTGVGLPGQKLTVYLEEDTPEVRAAVDRAIEPLNLEVPVQCMATGKFSR